MATVAASPSYTTTGPERTGIMDWLTTVDHKKIGILYLHTALFFFIVGGLKGIMRAQLMTPNGTVVSAEVQPAVHDARHDDGLPGHHADVRRVLQFPDPAADRGARRGLPAPECVQLLGLPAGRPVHHHPDPVQRRARRRLVCVHAAHGAEYSRART
jgi:hypothetical protein